jgi:hypothetical protein
MGNRGHPEKTSTSTQDEARLDLHLPAPSASYRRRAWVQFQRALDPLAPIKKLPPQPRA